MCCDPGGMFYRGIPDIKGVMVNERIFDAKPLARLQGANGITYDIYLAADIS